MIYFIKETVYPKEGQYLTKETHKDLNDQNWEFVTIVSGFMFKYCGDSAFMQALFSVDTNLGLIKVTNTGHALMNTVDPEAFTDMINVVKNGYTDDVWETIEKLLQTRLNINNGLMTSEIY